MAKLRLLLAHGSLHVPYYRETFEQVGCRPEDFRTFSDLSKLPLVGKADLRTNFPARVVAQNLPASRRQRGITSGSTGLPLEFYCDRASGDYRFACELFFREWAGVDTGDTRVTSGGGVPLPAQHRGLARLPHAARRALLDGPELALDSMTLTADQFRGALGGLPSKGRYYIFGYSSYIARLAVQLLEGGDELPAYPTVVITCSETQTEADAAAIERAFQSRPINRYGSWEMGWLAQTCPDNPAVLHTLSEQHIVRIVREDGRAAEPGESGCVVISDLSNWGMPFINYEMGDRAVAGAPCGCRRGFPTLMRLEGRAGEMSRTRSGKTIVPGEFGLNKLPNALEYVWEYQAVQTAPDTVVFRIVPTSRFNPEFSRELEAWLALVLGPGMRGTIETVDRIPLEPSGKRFIIKSHLPP